MHQYFFGAVSRRKSAWIRRYRTALCADSLAVLGGFARADFYGCRITLPIALRPASTFSASAVCASGKVRSTWEEILPSAVHFTSFSRLARFFSGLSRAH